MILDVVIPGAPVGKGRPRFARAGAGVRTYTPSATVEWEGAAVLHLRNAYHGPLLTDPVHVEVVAVGRRPGHLLPKEHGGSAPRSKPPPSGRMWRPTKPDADNVLKIALDALIKAGIIRDDVQAVSVSAVSVYAALDEAPYVRVRVIRAPELG